MADVSNGDFPVQVDIGTTVCMDIDIASEDNVCQGVRDVRPADDQVVTGLVVDLGHVPAHAGGEHAVHTVDNV